HWTTGFWPRYIEIFVEGSKVCNTWGQGDKGDHRNHVFNGKEEVLYRTDNRQVTVNAGKTGFQLIGLNTLRFIPTDHTLRVVDQKGGRITLKNEITEVTADEATGFVQNCVYRRDGRAIKEVFQYRPVAYPGPEQIIFPKVVVDVQYS